MGCRNGPEYSMIGGLACPSPEAPLVEEMIEGADHEFSVAEVDMRLSHGINLRLDWAQATHLNLHLGISGLRNQEENARSEIGLSQGRLEQFFYGQHDAFWHDFFQSGAAQVGYREDFFYP